MINYTKIVIFGAGGIGRRIYDILSDDPNIKIIGFIDNDTQKHGTFYNGIEIYDPQDIQKLDFDEVYFGTAMGVNEISGQLVKLGIDKNIINRSYIDTITNARKLFLKRFSEEHKTVINKTLAVAEAGVYRGEFAKSINQYFPNSPLYLFDTFEGFNNLDFVHEEDESLLDANHFKNTSVEHVIDRMPFASNCLIRKGYFPETTVDIHDDFIFVSLDLDLYKPTLDGLIFFYPKLVQGGCILIHDYFMASYPNVKKAVEEYQNSYHTNLVKIPIGDDLSIAIIKT